MTLSLVERWHEPGAPVIRFDEIRQAQEDYFEAINKVGISRAAYKIAAKEAVKAARDFFAGKIASRTAPRKDVEGLGAARWSTILASFQRMLEDYGRAGWALCWATVRTLGETFGTELRATWERLRILKEAKLVQFWDRWKGELHTYKEGRSNVYLLTVPIELFEWWVKLPEAKALLASLAQVPIEAAQAPRSSAPPPRQAPSSAPPSARKKSDPPSKPPEFLPALFHEVRGKDARYLGQGEETGGTMNAANALQCESVCHDEAAAAHSHCKERGLPLPDIAELSRELARMVVAAWLKEDGKNSILVDRRHAMGLLFNDFGRLAEQARIRWLARHARRHPPPAPPVPKPRFAVLPDELPDIGPPPAETEADRDEALQAVDEFRRTRGLATKAKALLSTAFGGGEGEAPPAPD